MRVSDTVKISNYFSLQPCSRHNRAKRVWNARYSSTRPAR